VNAFPKGWQPDDPSKFPVYEDRIGATPATPRVMRPIWKDLFQVGQSCVSNGIAHTRYAFTGEKTSPYPLHWLARGLRHPEIAHDPDGWMPDEGLSVSQTLRASELIGTCGWDLYNPSSKGFSINAKPFGAAMNDAQRWKPDISLVWGLGNGLVDAASTALDRGEIPLLCIKSDDIFEKFDGNGVLRHLSGEGEGHLTTLWDQKIENGERLFQLLNPWRNWAGGRTDIWVSESFVAEAVQEFIVHGGITL
jgi:hypothetical protein